MEEELRDRRRPTPGPRLARLGRYREPQRHDPRPAGAADGGGDPGRHPLSPPSPSAAVRLAAWYHDADRTTTALAEPADPGVVRTGPERVVARLVRVTATSRRPPTRRCRAMPTWPCSPPTPPTYTAYAHGGGARPRRRGGVAGWGGPRRGCLPGPAGAVPHGRRTAPRDVARASLTAGLPDLSRSRCGASSAPTLADTKARSKGTPTGAAGPWLCWLGGQSGHGCEMTRGAGQLTHPFDARYCCQVAATFHPSGRPWCMGRSAWTIPHAGDPPPPAPPAGNVGRQRRPPAGAVAGAGWAAGQACRSAPAPGPGSPVRHRGWNTDSSRTPPGWPSGRWPPTTTRSSAGAARSGTRTSGSGTLGGHGASVRRAGWQPMRRALERVGAEEAPHQFRRRTGRRAAAASD